MGEAKKYVSIKIPKEEMLEILWETRDGDGVILENKLSDSTRWELCYDLVFRYEDGNIYWTYYSKGATEYQDYGPWEDESEVECWLVEPYEKTVTDYRKVEAEVG